MSTTTGADHAPHDQYVDYDEFVDFQIEKARNHIKATDIFTTLTTLAAAFVSYLFLFVVCDQWVFAGGFSDWARMSLLGVMLATMGTILMRRVVVPLIRRVHPLYAARMLEKSDPKLQSNLLNFVDLQHSDGLSSSPQVVRAMQKRAALELSHIDVDEAIDRRPLLRVAYALLAIVVVSALYIVLSPKDPFQSVKRALLPMASIAVATETTISDVTPGDDKVPARTLLTIEADVRGKDADSVRILFTTADHKYVDEAVEMHRIDADLPRFRGTLNGENGRGLLQSLHYAIAAGDARTREFQVEVVQPPAARVDDVHYGFPTYMQLEERTTPGGNIDGWEGAQVTVRATANMPVKSATVVLTDSEDAHAKGEEIAMEVVDGTKLTARWKLEFRSDGTFARFYHVQLRTARNETDPDPALHTVRIRPDQRPDVELVFPRGDLTQEHAKPANAIIPLVIQASDPDFQLRSIRLMAELNGEELRIPPLFDGRDLGQSFRGSYDWDLSKHNLRAGQKIQFWIEARDNKQPTANRGVTPRLTLEIRPEKSADEIHQDLVAEKKEQEDQLARADDTRNQEGRDELQAKDSGDETGDKPKENDAPKDRTTPTEPTQPPEPEKDPKGRRDDRSEDRNATEADENRSERQPKPSGNENERALEKLLQKQAEDEQKKDEQQKKKEDSQTKPSEADQNQSGSDTKSSGKPGQKRDSREKPNAGDEGDKNTSESEKDPSGKPSGKPGDTPRPEGTPEKKSEPPKGNEKKPNKSDKPGETADPNAGKNPEKAADPAQGGKSRDDKQKPSDSADAKNPDSKKGPGKKPDPEQKNGSKGPKNEGDKPKDNGSGNKDNDDSGKGDSGRDKPEEKTDAPMEGSEGPDKEGTEKKPGKNAADKDATEKTDDPKNDKTPEPGDRGDDSPPSDGKGDDENATSDESGNQSGTPSKSKSKGGAETEGDASNGDPAKPDPKGSEKKSDSDPAEGGEEEPAEDSPDARKRKATGNETGEATGSQEDDPDAVKAKNDLQRKPGSEPGKTKPSDKPSKKPSEKTGTPADDKRNREPGTSSSTDDPRNTKRAPDSKGSKEPMPQTDDPASRKSESDRPNDRSKHPDNPPDAGNQAKEPGKSPPQPKQPSTGQDGRSAASDQGKSGGNKEGAGDKSPMSGDDVQSSEPTGKPGTKSGEGSTAKSRQAADNKTPKPGEGNSSAESSKSGNDGSPSGQSGGKSASKPGKGGGQPGGTPDGQAANSSEGSGVTGAPAKNGSSNEGEGSGSDGSDPTGDRPRNSDGSGTSPDQDEEANLENAKKASNLLLKRLQKQLERGEVDQKLLDEMGWKNLNDVKNFTRYLESNLENTGEDNSAEAVARRLQFEETLKGMRLGSETERRLGGNGPQRRVLPTSVRNVPLPAEYREIQEAYSKSLSKQSSKGAKTDTGKPSSPTKAAPKK